MKIKWLAHAAFLLEGDGLRVITDPYEPNDVINLPPINEPADIVVRSSNDDEAHCFVGTIPEGFELVTATEIVDHGTTARDLRIEAIWSQESLIHKEIPRDNAMYRFRLDGIDITHMGDVGNSLSEEQLAALAGTDVLLAPVGGPPTIDLDDLYQVIQRLKPRLVIPMHYRIPGPRFFMLPVSDFIAYFPAETVRRLETSEVDLDPDSLPEETRILLLEPALSRPS